MFAAYTDAGAPARLVMLPPVGSDGHGALRIAPQELLWPPVESFLGSLSLPIRTVIDLPPLSPLPAPAGLNATCAAGFRAYAEARVDAKAFAANPEGHCGWQIGADTLDMARESALAACSRRADDCRLYAAGQALAAP
jgi:hypothetical protein